MNAGLETETKQQNKEFELPPSQYPGYERRDEFVDPEDELQEQKLGIPCFQGTQKDRPANMFGVGPDISFGNARARRISEDIPVVKPQLVSDLFQ